MTEAAAQRTLIGVGFTVRTVSRGTSDDSEDGIVLDQDPAAGTRASAGSQVVIVVGRIPTATS
jgi:beta-lactam-binding protein with PASTA domain